MSKIFTVLTVLLFLFFVLPVVSAQNEANFTVYGQVFDTNGITPVNGVTVTITVSGSSLSTTTTDARTLNGTPINGTFYFPNLPVGADAGVSMTLTASTTGKSASTTVARAASEPQRVDLTLSTGSSGSGSGSSSSGTSSGGGGGGGSTGEEYSNVLARESKDELIAVGLPAKYYFTTVSSPVNEIVITSNINAGLINVQIEVLKGKSTLVKENPQGTIYKYLNIWVGTSGYATPRNIKEATIKFKVETSWIESSNFKDTEIVLMRWDGTKWITLETLVKTKDSTFTYFEAKADAFSPFVITGLKGTTSEKATPVITGTSSNPIEIEQPTPAHTKKTAGFEAVLSIAAVWMIFISRRIRR